MAKKIGYLLDELKSEISPKNVAIASASKAALMAGILGQAGPQVAIPEELVTIPLAAAIAYFGTQAIKNLPKDNIIQSAKNKVLDILGAMKLAPSETPKTPAYTPPPDVIKQTIEGVKPVTVPALTGPTGEQKPIITPLPEDIAPTKPTIRGIPTEQLPKLGGVPSVPLTPRVMTVEGIPEEEAKQIEFPPLRKQIAGEGFITTPSTPQLKRALKAQPYLRAQREIATTERILNRALSPSEIKPIINKTIDQLKVKDILELDERKLNREILRAEQRASKEGYRFGRKEATQQIRARLEAKRELSNIISNIKSPIPQNIPASHKKLLGDIQSSIVTRKRTPETLQDIESLRGYVEREGTAGIPLKRLRLLQTTDLNNLSVDDLKNIGQEINTIKEEGKKIYNQQKLYDKLLVNNINREIQISKPTEASVSPIAKQLQKEQQLGSIEKIIQYKLGNGTIDNPIYQNIWVPIQEGAEKQRIAFQYKQELEDKMIRDLQINPIDFFGKQEQITDRIALTPNQKVGVYIDSLDADKYKGLIRGRGLSKPEIEKIINSLTPQEKVLGDYISKEVYNRTGNVEEIERVKMATDNEPLGRVDGTYSFYFIDRDLSPLKLEEINLADELLKEKGLRRGLQKGFTIERSRAQLAPSIDAYGDAIRYISMVEHYKAMAIPLKKVSKILRNPDIRNTITKRHGTETMRALDKWLNDVTASGANQEAEYVAQILDRLRLNAGASIVLANLNILVNQTLSFFPAMSAIDRLTGSEMPALRGLREMVLHPKQITEIVSNLSPEMKYRAKDFERYIRELDQLHSKNKFAAYYIKFQQTLGGLISMIDHITAFSVWYGLYQELIKTMPSDKAKYLCDKMVRETQPAAQVKDLPSIMRGGAISRMFTMFKNMPLKFYNFIRYDMIEGYRKGLYPKGRGPKDILYWWIIPSALLSIIRKRKPPTWMQLIKDQIAFPLNSIPLVGDMLSTVAGVTPYGVSVPLFESLGRFKSFAQSKKIPTKIKHGFGLSAMMTGFPFTELERDIIRPLMKGGETSYKRKTKKQRGRVTTKRGREAGYLLR